MTNNMRDVLTNTNTRSIIPSLTPKTPQTQYTSRFAAILFLREERNAAYMIFEMEALPLTAGMVIVLIERVRNAKDFVQIGIDVEEYYRIKDEEN